MSENKNSKSKNTQKRETAKKYSAAKRKNEAVTIAETPSKARASQPKKAKKTIKESIKETIHTRKAAESTTPAVQNSVRKTVRSSRISKAGEKASTKTVKNAMSRKRTKGVEKKPSVKVYFLGGLNEIGKNLTVFECQEDMIIVDCGMTFPSDDMLGVDLVIPDFTFIEENASKIRGVFLTHGHEDHIGALPYLFKKQKFLVFGTTLTLGLVRLKFKEHGLLGEGESFLHETSAGETVTCGCFSVEFIHVNHSIYDAVAFALHTPGGTIVHTGDFKIDCTPEKGEMIDLGRFAMLGKEGVLALFADSTNAESPGFTPTEQTVKASFEHIFERSENKRIIIATFASNISRVQQIINCASKYGRKVAFSGRSMANVMGLAQQLGILEIPQGTLIDLDIINRFPPEQLVLITTGTQGEATSALTRMAFADHRKVSVGPEDIIIISARPIPGNEKTIGTVVDELLKRGCEVLYESMYEVHVSGHARQEELKMIHALVKPKYFIPVHGEQKHLRKHAELAERMGMDPERVFIGDIGSAIELSDSGIKKLPDVTAGKILVDGLGVGDVGSVVLKDRKHLGEDGLIVIVCTIDSYSSQLLSGPDIVSRGFVYVKESESVIDDIKQTSLNAIERGLRDGYDDMAIKYLIRDSVSRMLYEKTHRSPMILPVIMDV